MTKSENKKSYGAWSPQGRIAHLKGPPSEGGGVLIDHLTRELSQTSREKLLALIELGAVYVNKLRARDPQFKVEASDLIRVHLDPKRYQVHSAEIATIFENENCVILNKPAGLPMHATLDNAVENLASAFESKLFVTHRLDVPTSGLVVLAKNKDYQAVFNDLVARREVLKIYQALTLTAPPMGLLSHWMLVEARAPKKVFAESQSVEIEALKAGGARFDECLLAVIETKSIDFDLGRDIETRAPGFVSKIKLITGRTHQIRAQLAKLGAPLVGDEMYGGMASKVFGLHACSLKFTDPISGKVIEFTLEREW